MKKTVAFVLAVAVALAIAGCEKKKESQQPIAFAPATPPLANQIEQLQQAVKADPKNGQAWTDLGNVLMDSQQYAEAVDAYEKSLSFNPRNVNVLTDQGTCYRGVGKFEKAVELYRRALRIDPNFPNAHRNLGIVLGFDLNKKADAIKEFKRYLELVPNGPESDPTRQAIHDLEGRK